MTVPVKNYVWHRTWHSRIMSDPGYQAAPLDVRGAYDTLRQLAGSSNNCGGFIVGTGKPLNETGVVRWLSGNVPDLTPRRARTIVRKMMELNLLARRQRTGWCYIPTWEAEQTSQYSAAAVRQQRHRERVQAVTTTGRIDHGMDVHDRSVDAIEIALQLTGEDSARARNTWSMHRRAIGDNRFRDALAELKDAVQAGKAKRPGGLLQHVCKEIALGTHMP